MYPVLGREVIEGKEDIGILRQALTCTGELLPVEGDKGVHGYKGLLPGIGPVDVMDLLLGPGLCPLRHLVEDIGCLMYPAALFLRIGVYLPQCGPEAETPVADGEIGPVHKTSLLQIGQQLHPGELAFPVTVEDADKLLGAVLSGADDDEHALLSVLRVLQSHVEVDPVRPEVDISPALEGTLRPLPVFILPLSFKPHDGVGGEPLHVLAQDCTEGTGEVAGGDALEVEDGNEIIEGGYTSEVSGKDGTGKRLFILTSVTYSRLLYRYGADAGQDGTLRGEAVTDNIPPAAGNVDAFHVVRYLPLYGALEELSCPFPDDLFERALYLFNLFLIFVLFRVILFHKAYPFFCPSAKGFFEIM